jgi:hypothetical protein
LCELERISEDSHGQDRNQCTLTSVQAYSHADWENSMPKSVGRSGIGRFCNLHLSTVEYDNVVLAGVPVRQTKVRKNDIDCYANFTYRALNRQREQGVSSVDKVLTAES